MGCCGAVSKTTFGLSNTKFDSMGKTPEPVTIEKARLMMKQDGFTACEQAKRYKSEYERKTKGGITNVYTARLKQYADIFEQLCKEEELQKQENISE